MNRMSLARGCCRYAIAACLMLITVTAWSFEVGDKVSFLRLGKTNQGEVVEVRSGGKFLRIATTVDGKRRNILVVASSAKLLPTSGGAAVRTWSDQTGSFSVKASLVGQTETTAKLKKTDGRVVDVPIEKLSLADQEYLALQDAGATGAETANPFAGGAMAANGSQSASTSASSGGSPAMIGGMARLDLAMPIALPQGKSLVLTKMEPPSSVSADVSPYDFSKLGNAAMEVTKVEFRQELTRPLIVSSDGTTLTCALKSSWSSDAKKTTVYRIDGRQGVAKPVAQSDGVSFWMGASDPASGDVLAIIDESRGTKAASLGIISGIGDGSPRVKLHWRLSPTDAGKTDFVTFRRVLPGGKAMVGHGGTAYLIDYERGACVWNCKQSMFNEPAVSAGGRYTALVDPQGDQIAILETATGNQLGSIPIGKVGSASLGFSPDAKHIAIADGTRVRVFNVASAELDLEHEANIPLSKHGAQLAWVGNDYLILPTGPMLSLKRNLIVWDYQFTRDSMEYSDRIHQGLYGVSDRGSIGVIRLPHETALKAATRVANDLAAVSSGDAIAIDVKGSGPGATTQQVRQWLEDAAKKAGYKVDSGATTRMVATIAREKTEERSYRNFGSFGTTEVKFTPYSSKVEVKQNSKTLWQRSARSSMPYFITGDKKLKQVARESEKVSTGVFENLALPAEILKPEYQRGFGKTVVSIRGTQDFPTSTSGVRPSGPRRGR